MPWLRSEGKFPKNDKVWELSDAAYRLYDAGRHYAVENLTDGHVPSSRISSLTPKPATQPQISSLIRAKLWHLLPDICDSCVAQRKEHHALPLARTGFIVHHFFDYNPSRAEYEEEQSRRRSLATLGGQARARQVSRVGGRFTSRAAGDETSSTASGTAGDTTSGTAGRPAGLAGDENAPAAPAAPPAVSPAPYPVSRPVAIATRTSRARGEPDDDEPEIPAGTAAKAAEVRGTKAPHHVGPAAQRIVASARARG